MHFTFNLFILVLLFFLIIFFLFTRDFLRPLTYGVVAVNIKLDHYCTRQCNSDNLLEHKRKIIALNENCERSGYRPCPIERISRQWHLAARLIFPTQVNLRKFGANIYTKLDEGIKNYFLKTYLRMCSGLKSCPKFGWLVAKLEASTILEHTKVPPSTFLSAIFYRWISKPNKWWCSFEMTTRQRPQKHWWVLSTLSKTQLCSCTWYSVKSNKQSINNMVILTSM